MSVKKWAEKRKGEPSAKSEEGPAEPRPGWWDKFGGDGSEGVFFDTAEDAARSASSTGDEK